MLFVVYMTLAECDVKNMGNRRRLQARKIVKNLLTKENQTVFVAIYSRAEAREKENR